MSLIIVTFELLKMSLIGVQKGIFYKPNGKKLAVYLESLGPIFTKFGQLLSTRTDILDFETAKELESLTDNCKPFNVAIFRKIVESELGDSIENISNSILDLDDDILVFAIGNQVGAGQEILNKLSESRAYD